MIINKISAVLGNKLIKISDLSKGTGISRTTITNLYYRKSDSITFKNLDKLCSYLGCTVNDLLEFQEEERP